MNTVGSQEIFPLKKFIIFFGGGRGGGSGLGIGDLKNNNFALAINKFV